MTRRDVEKSRAQGRPRYFYHFFRSVEDWYYTSYRTVLAYNGQAYLPLEINHNEIVGGGEDRPGLVEVTLPTDSDLGLILQAGSAPSSISLRIAMQHANMLDDPAIIFNGELRGTQITDDLCVVTAVPLQSRLSMVMPRGLFERRQCVWNTYTPECGVDPALFTFAGTVAGIDGLIVSVTGASAFNADPAFFTLGVLTKGEYRGMIERQDGDEMTLQHAIPGLIVGDAVTLLAGDDRTKETCLNKFDDIERHMSFYLIPVQNPHYGQGLRDS